MSKYEKTPDPFKITYFGSGSNLYVIPTCAILRGVGQRCAIRFCLRLGDNATETPAKLQQAYGDSVLSRAQIFRCLKHCQKEESQLKMNNEAEGLYLKEPMRITTESWICAFRSSVVSQNDREELNLTHTTFHQVFDQLIGNEKSLRKRDSKKPFTRLEEHQKGKVP
ncbi:hypothetical protein J6590_012851 [Homalodisca vitripennis]|nr:hypothetical protein J6590_012851 [Homalodisca vitripennis]